ncbi:hypothetical protein KGQ27_00115 [Patescibacteria group bacterium]|nr:hypothetical protein [Patescibacteria group bacterium]MDE1946621.1 hypothetical protein [Patescibacteria group bacterium]MDE2010575.1 hypothetical protein [Patescibacteria group bacterium]MDE2233163.1 hypothetical protein [Patescibacteria group bacterium]
MKIRVKKSIRVIFALITGVWIFLFLSSLYSSLWELPILLGVLGLFWIILFKKVLVDSKIEINGNKITIVTPKLFRVAAYRNFTLEKYEWPLAEIKSLILKRVKKPIQNEASYIGYGQLSLIVSTSTGEHIIPVDTFSYDAMVRLFKPFPIFKEENPTGR